MTDWRLTNRLATSRGTIAWEVAGTGPPVVLVHGFPGNSYTWRTLARRLAEHYRVWTFDLLGFGQSEQRDGQLVGLGDQAQLLVELVWTWQLDSPAIVAHDAGAAIALGACLLDGLRPRCLLLLDAATLNPCISENSQHARRFIEAYSTMPAMLYEQIMRAHVPTTMFHPMPEDTFQGYFRPWSTQAGQAAYYRFLAQLDEGYLDQLLPQLGRLDGPVRIVWGEQDTWIPVATGHRLHELIEGAELVTISDAGHFLLDDAPGAVYDAVSQFLDHHAAQPRDIDPL